MASAAQQPRLRIGIDTGGTFTDIVSVDSGSGAMRVTKVASTPSQSGHRAGARRASAILDAAGGAPDEVAGLAHGTTVATNALLQGEISGLGLIVTAGFRHILEIARQSVPEGYGNSYFWVKPERIVPLHFVREVGGRLNFRGRGNCARSTRRACAPPRISSAARASARSASASSTPMPIPPTSGASRRSSRKDYPDCTLSLSCAVLPEYREYERAVTTLVDAFVKPHMERYLRRVHDELGAGLKDKPFLVMQSSGGVASAEQVRAQADHDGAVGPGGRRARQRGGRRDRRLPRRRDARRRRHLDRPLPDRRRQAARHQRRRGRRVPGAHPDDRHRDHRHRRRIDRLDQPRRPPQGRAEERGRRTRTDVLSQRRRRADHHRRQSCPRAHSSGAHRRRHRARRRRGRARGSRRWRSGFPAR